MQKWKKVLAVAISATTIGGAAATAALAGRQGSGQPDRAIERQIPGRGTEQRGPEPELRGRANEQGENRRHEDEAENEADEDGVDEERGPSSNSGPGSHHGENEDQRNDNGEFGSDR